LSKAIILQYWDIHKLLNNKQFHELDKINVNDFAFIVGPYLVGLNHWNALIINIKDTFFLSIDSHKIKSDLLDIHFKDWLSYYESHYGSSNNLKKIYIDHPLKIDGRNCGVFVMLFIVNYKRTGKISSETIDTNNFNEHRLKIAKTLKNFK
jgi:Ulp1 family protease